MAQATPQLRGTPSPGKVKRSTVFWILLLIIGLILMFQLRWFVLQSHHPPLFYNSVPKTKDQPPDTITTELGVLTDICLEPRCIDEEAAKLARAYPLRTDQKWCTRPKEEAPFKTKAEDDPWKGILLVKIPKAASSTSAGVAIRISLRKNCADLQWMHRYGDAYANRSREESFLFSTIRNPGSRAMSTLFFHVVSRRNVTPTDSFIKQHLLLNHDRNQGTTTQGQGGYQLRYMAPFSIPPYSAWDKAHPRHVLNLDRVIDNVNRTLDSYDFILVTERMNESLVAMAMILGIDVGDVLVTSSKVAGNYYHLVHKGQGVFQCIPTLNSFVSDGVRQYLASRTFRSAHYGDLLLHAASKMSLDMTIEALGRERFEANLRRFEKLQEMEEQECAPYIQYPCSNEGQPQPQVAKDHCYLAHYDFGCGHECIDKLIDRVETSKELEITP